MLLMDIIRNLAYTFQSKFFFFLRKLDHLPQPDRQEWGTLGISRFDSHTEAHDLINK